MFIKLQGSLLGGTGVSTYSITINFIMILFLVCSYVCKEFKCSLVPLVIDLEFYAEDITKAIRSKGTAWLNEVKKAVT